MKRFFGESFAEKIWELGEIFVNSWMNFLFNIIKIFTEFSARCGKLRKFGIS